MAKTATRKSRKPRKPRTAPQRLTKQKTEGARINEYLESKDMEPCLDLGKVGCYVIYFVFVVTDSRGREVCRALSHSTAIHIVQSHNQKEHVRVYGTRKTPDVLTIEKRMAIEILPDEHGGLPDTILGTALGFEAPQSRLLLGECLSDRTEFNEKN